MKGLKVYNCVISSSSHNSYLWCWFSLTAKSSLEWVLGILASRDLQ